MARQTKPAPKPTARDYERVTALLVELLTNPATPLDLITAVEEYIIELENGTQINVSTPEVLRTAYPLMLEVAAALDLDGKRHIRATETRRYLQQRRAKGGR